MNDWDDPRVEALCDRAHALEDGAAAEALVCEAIALGAELQRERYQTMMRDAVVGEVTVTSARVWEETMQRAMGAGVRDGMP